MLLKHWEHKRTTNERGSALIAVLGVMVVGLLLTTLIASSVVRAFGFSTSTRAAMQSHAAADAGVAAARAGLYVPGNCALQPTPGQYVSSGSLVYTATILSDSGTGFAAGCPTLTTTRVQILSKGTAQASGVAGVTAGNTRTVEATFNYITPGPQPSGPAIYLYSGGVVEANSLMKLTNGGNGGLVVQNGNLDCSKNNAQIVGDIVVKGDLTFTGSCQVVGNAIVTGLATLGSGSITQNLSASGVNPNPPGAHVGGTYTQTTAVPATPPWTDVTYSPLDWTDSNGVFQVSTAPIPLSCTLSSGSLGGTSLGSDRPVILDMRNCPGGPVAGNNTAISLTSDVVIFAEQFNWANSLTFGSSNSSVHRLWFITPDYAPDGKPTCNYQYLPGTATNKSPGTPNPNFNPSTAVQGDFVVNNSLTVSQVFATTNLVRAMLYTPCAFIGKNGFTWNGQIYAGAYSALQNNPTFSTDSVGIAGHDLGTGLPSTVITNPKPGSVISNRDLAG